MKKISSKSSFAAARRDAALAVVAVLTLSGRAEGAAIQAESMDEAAVWAAAVQCNHNGGDTVIIPAGVSDWLTNLNVTWPMTFQFAGVNQSIIEDDITNYGNPANVEAVLSFTNPNTNALKRVTGLTVVNGPLPKNINSSGKGAIQFANTNMDGNCRLDHCSFTNVIDTGVCWYEASYGLVDHCYATYTNTSEHFMEVEHPYWNSHGTNSYGDGSFMSSSGLGSSNAVYLEDCVFYNPSLGSAGWTVVDCFEGGHYVARYNLLTNATFATHGTESTGETRGTRLLELYCNTFVDSNTYANIVQYRSGTGVIFSNTAYGFEALATMDAYRCDTYSPNYWFGAQGTNRLDEEPNTNALFYVTNASSSQTNVLTVAGADWTTNQWVGYCVIDETTPGYTTNFGIIRSNSSNTAYFVPAVLGNTYNMAWNNGDVGAFHSLTACLDMPGMGRCTNQIARSAAGAPTGVWPGQSIEPIYCWGNMLSTSASGSNPTAGTLVANIGILTNGIHYFNSEKPGYAPFTYPHPLTLALGGSNPPVVVLGPPTDLRVVSGL
jgi:hypothetical protein